MGITYAHLAQSVEHSAVNRTVVGSSPTVGANEPGTPLNDADHVGSVHMPTVGLAAINRKVVDSSSILGAICSISLVVK